MDELIIEEEIDFEESIEDEKILTEDNVQRKINRLEQILNDFICKRVRVSHEAYKFVHKSSKQEILNEINDKIRLYRNLLNKNNSLLIELRAKSAAEKFREANNLQKGQLSISKFRRSRERHVIEGIFDFKKDFATPSKYKEIHSFNSSYMSFLNNFFQFKKYCEDNKLFMGSTDRLAFNKAMYGKEEFQRMLDVMVSERYTYGRVHNLFSSLLCSFCGQQFCELTNSGSSANFIAIKALTSPLLGDRMLKPGDEVITTALCFPTNITPLLDIGLTIRFIDVEKTTLNPSLHQITDAINDKTKLIFLSHNLGFNFPAAMVKEVCKSNKIWFVEDFCDALGGRFDDPLTKISRPVGSFGDISTLSFYPAHHISAIEGGAIFTSDSKLYRIIDSLVNWGRDCSCNPGEDNRCGKRFEKASIYAELPEAYDHKYMYSHFGYNLKMSNLHAAVGYEQLKKLLNVIDVRKNNYNEYVKNINTASRLNTLYYTPDVSNEWTPSVFGFPWIPKKKIKNRKKLIEYFEKTFQTRPVFAGNILRQPCSRHLDKEKIKYASLVNTDFIMDNVIWTGVGLGITPTDIDKFCNRYKNYLDDFRGEIFERDYILS